MTVRRACIAAVLVLALAGALTAAARWSHARLAGTIGLTEKVYGNADFTGEPIATQLTETIDLSILDAKPDLPRRFVSMRWEGVWQGPTGTAEIFAGGDDEVRVSIDGRLLIERNEAVGFHTMSAPVTLDAGPHRLLVEYVQRGGGMAVRVMWGPGGGEALPFQPASLFPNTPDPALLRRARLATTLAAVSERTLRAGLLLTAAIALFVTSRWTWRWFARGVPQAAARRTTTVAQRWTERVRRPAFWLTAAAAVGFAAVTRARGFDPPTLWADDVWFACIAKLDSFWSALTVPAPVAPGFVALLWTARRTMADPEISLQIVPFACGLLGPVIVGAVVSRLTASYAVGAAGMALAFGAGSLANYSIFVKAYSADFALTAALLLMGVLVLKDNRRFHGLLAAIGLAAASVSVPSVMVSAPLVHLAALKPAEGAADPRAARRRRWLAALAFDIGLAVLYVAFLRARSNPQLRSVWAGSFVPTSSMREAIEFLKTTGWTAIQEALPPPLVMLAPLVGVGLVSCFLRRGWRWFGLFITTVYLGVVVAAALQIYPIGIGPNGKARITMYTYPVAIVLVAAAFDFLTRWLPLRSLVRIAAAAYVALTVARLPVPEYFKLDHVEMVWALQSKITDADALILNTSAAYTGGYYSQWRIDTYTDDSPQGFAVKFDRPRTLTLRRSAEEGAGGLEDVDALLTREQPPRVFFFSSRRGTEAAEAAIKAHGFAEVSRKSSNVSTRLIEYQRTSALVSGKQEERK